MTRFRLSLLTLTLLPSLLNLTADGQGSRKTWPVQTKGQEGLREPQERATLPVPTSGFSQPAAQPAGAPGPSLARRGAGEWARARGWRMAEAPKVVVLRDAATGARVLPVYASDNYVSLVPGEQRRITIEVSRPTRGMTVELKGWNVRRALIPVAAR